LQSTAKPKTCRPLGRWLLPVIALIAVGLGSLAWLVDGDRRLPQAPVVVDIAPGSSLASIAAQLRQEGVVSSAHAFSLYLRSRHDTGSLQAAEYDFPAHQSMRDVAAILIAGGHPANIWVTLPEGYTARQIAQRLAAAGLVSVPAFMDVVIHTHLRFGRTTSRGLEGFLFPDTYLIPRHASVTSIITLLTNQLLRELPPHALQAAHRLGYSIPQIVTIASMVEREAKVDDERRTMAGVYYNRLRIGMPLEVDATIEYALPQHKNALSLRDLKLNSPYNTYRYHGLPPTPIANPGRKSLLAAFCPAKTEYLYYVYRGGGRHQFSHTLDEQQAAERKYLR
jgi:UPF0755 protein